MYISNGCVGSEANMKSLDVICVVSAALCVQATFAADWYAKETRWAGHDPDIIRYEDGYALATTDNHMLMQFSEDALNWKNGEPRNNHVDSPVPARKAYRDHKGRYFDKQIPYRVMF